MSPKPDPDRAVERLAATQHGAISRAQALEAGFTRHAVQGRLDAGSWIRILPGVYKLAVTPTSWTQRVTAAYLWASPAGVVSHLSAAKSLGIEGIETDRADILVPRFREASRDWLITHQGSFEPKEVALSGPVRITRPLRTIMDLGSVVSESTLEIAVEHCLRRKMFSLDDLSRRLEASRWKKGSPRLRRVLGRVSGSDEPTESVFEVRLRRAIRQAGLPQPVGQLAVETDSGRYRLDFAYPDENLGIEANGYAFHSGRDAFESDSDRLSALAAHGWRFIHVTWNQLVEDPDQVTTRIHRALADPLED